MVRLVIGYVKHGDDSWADMYRRLRANLEAATRNCTLRDWSDELQKQKVQLLRKLTELPESALLRKIHLWHPTAIFDAKYEFQPKRQRGRPRATWHYQLSSLL